MKPNDFILAARVPHSVEPQQFGLWTIERYAAANELQRVVIGFDRQTRLRRITLASLHLEPGEMVMEDSRRELSKHLPIWLAAHHHPRSVSVLVTGLGLGCVVRGLLASRNVTHIDVVEIDRGILRVIGPEFADNPRVTLHCGDALDFDFPIGTKWDFAWHDLWTENGDGLQVLHARLFMRYGDDCLRQGAWNFPRWASRLMPKPPLGAPRLRRLREPRALLAAE